MGKESQVLDTSFDVILSVVQLTVCVSVTNFDVKLGPDKELPATDVSLLNVFSSTVQGQ